MIPVILGLGSNAVFESFEPLQILSFACKELNDLLSVHGNEMIISSVYRTKAMYVTDQEDFYNMAVSGFVSESCTPRQLLQSINKIEAKYGRDRSREYRFGPRSLDIDIEFFGNLVVEEPDLQIPHPRLYERAFVLTPMLEILSESADCIKRECIAEHLRHLSDQGVHLFMDVTQFRKKFLPEAAHGNKQQSKNAVS